MPILPLMLPISLLLHILPLPHSAPDATIATHAPVEFNITAILYWGHGPRPIISFRLLRRITLSTTSTSKTLCCNNPFKPLFVANYLRLLYQKLHCKHFYIYLISWLERPIFSNHSAHASAYCGPRLRQEQNIMLISHYHWIWSVAGMMAVLDHVAYWWVVQKLSHIYKAMCPILWCKLQSTWRHRWSPRGKCTGPTPLHHI